MSAQSDDDSDSAMWASYKAMKQAKRADNRSQSADVLTREGIRYTSHNGGAHLIVEGVNGYIDFWPGPGRWTTRDGIKGFGVRKLVNHIKAKGGTP